MSRRKCAITQGKAKGGFLNNKLPADVRKKHKRFASKERRREGHEEEQEKERPEQAGKPLAAIRGVLPVANAVSVKAQVLRKADTDGPVDDCDNCGSAGGHSMMCDACSASLCTNCDVHNGCPLCGGEMS